MKWIKLGFILAVAMLPAHPVAGTEIQRPSEEQRIKRAVFAEGKLWLLSDSGVVSTISEGSDKRFKEVLGEAVLDMCLQDLHPIALTCETRTCDSWAILRHSADGWSTVDSVKSEGEKLVAILCEPDSVAILASRSFIRSKGDQQTSIALSEEISPTFSPIQLLEVPDGLFLGKNIGEWGGGLWRIDRHTGQVLAIDRRSSNVLCSGPLNRDCDPVTGIAIEPWKPDCVVIAIGLVHFMSHGRLVEVCGDDVRTLYSKPHEEELASDRHIVDSVPFYGMANSEDALWTAGTDGIYRIDANGVSYLEPLPKCEWIDGVEVNFDLPHLAIVLETISAGRSVRRAIPMVVAR
jgi:hypothetical protein